MGNEPTLLIRFALREPCKTGTSWGLCLYSRREILSQSTDQDTSSESINFVYVLLSIRFLCKLSQLKVLFLMLGMTDQARKPFWSSLQYKPTLSKVSCQQYHSGPSYALTPWFVFISALSIWRFISCDNHSEPTPSLLDNQQEWARGRSSYAFSSLKENKLLEMCIF